MKYLVYLITLLFSTAVAQNPTILQGNYVSNVFGQANFVKNPNAQTNVANVTVSSATVTRPSPMVTPLVATTEFNVTVTSANGTITWATRSFDAGMKNQNCEARFTYRGFQATSKAQIKQGANVIAELTLTPSATDPRIASINFPCGDLSSATTFVITDSATLSGVHEIGGIYVGLATNQANVAQAEVVVRATKSTIQTVPAGANTKIIYQSEALDTNNYWDTSTSTFTATKPGCYKFEATISSTLQSWQTGAQHFLWISVNGDVNLRINGDRKFVTNTGTIYAGNKVVASSCFNVGETAEVYYYHTRTTNANVDNNVWYTRLTITRFPSSSELVVTPETQNVWGGVEHRVGQGLYSGTAEPTGYNPFSNAVFNVPSALVGKAAVTTTNSGNDLGFSIQNLPVGSYKLSVSGQITANPGGTAGDVVLCTFRIRETTTSTTVAEQVYQGQRSTLNTVNSNMAFQGVFENTSTSLRNFRLEGSKTSDNSSGNTGTCNARGNVEGNNSATKLSFTIEPLDNASNSALYVQGPVKAAETGAPIPAGYQGEVNQSILSTTTTTTNGWQVIKSISLTPGVWLCSGGVIFDKGSATYSEANLVASFHHTGASSPSGGISYDSNAGRLYMSTTYFMSKFGLGINPAVIRVDGSNIYTPWGSGSGSTLYLWFYAGTFTGTITTGSSHTCTRLN